MFESRVATLRKVFIGAVRDEELQVLARVCRQARHAERARIGSGRGKSVLRRIREMAGGPDLDDREVCRRLVDRAKAGDVRAAQVVLAYVLGRNPGRGVRAGNDAAGPSPNG